MSRLEKRMKIVTRGWQRLSLRKRFLLTFITLMLLALLMFSLLSARLLQQEVGKAVESEMNANLILTQSLAEQWLKDKQLQLQTLAKHLSAEVNPDEWKRLLTIGAEAADFNLLYVGTEKGQFIKSEQPKETPEGYDPRRRPWFIQAQVAQGMILTPVYSSASTGSLTTTLAMPLLNNARHVLGGDLYISNLVANLLQQEMRWTSQLIMYGADDVILAHQDQDLVQKKLAKEVIGFDTSSKQGIQRVSFQGKDWLAATIKVKSTDWNFVLLVAAAEVQAIHFDLVVKMLLLAIIILLCGGLFVFWVARALTQPLLDFQQQLKNITSTLDLSQRLVTKDQAELGYLARQTNKLLERLDFTIKGVLNNSENLTEAAGRLALTAGLVGRNTNKQQEVGQSMAAAVERMSSSVAEITSTMEELSASSTQIADYSQSVVDVANLTLDSSKKGATAMQNLQLHMTDIEHNSANSLQEIIQLGSKSKAISKVMDLINTLADQTKLIAFNAALEASSAGESGKRFSVVASEIRRLADSVTDSTHEIEDRIQEIQDSIHRLVITSEKGAGSIKLGLQVSSETAEDLNALVKAASRTSNAAQQISLSTKQQKTASSQVVIALHDIANASSYNAESVRNITDISEEMIRMSEKLNQLVDEFKVEA